VFLLSGQIGGIAMSLTNSIALPLPAELEILEILWCRHLVSARELHSVLVVRRPISHRAVKTILSIMQTKGLVETRLSHQPVMYHAVYSRNEFQQRVLMHVADSLFQGDMSRLLCSVLVHPGLEPTHKDPLDYPVVTPAKQVN
jgi:predicted transcriptional regulator